MLAASHCDGQHNSNNSIQASEDTNHAPNIEIRRIRLLLCRNTLDPSLLDVQLSRQSLDLRIH